jgi:hypothetical protein
VNPDERTKNAPIAETAPRALRKSLAIFVPIHRKPFLR